MSLHREYSSASNLAAQFPPYALHYELPYVRQRNRNRETRSFYNIPLPPKVSPSHVFQNEDLPAVSPRHDIRVVSPPPRIETTVVPVQSGPDHGLENRLALQDRNIEMLLDRAVRIKEDLVSALGRTNSGLQEERYARELLQQHVNVMVLLCQKLSQEIEFLWYEFQNKQTGSDSTISNLRQLELSHVHNITDVKSKADNLQSSLSHLNRDVRTLADRGRNAERQVDVVGQQSMERYYGLDARLTALATKVDANYNESIIHLRNLEKESENRVVVLEGQMRASLENLRSELAATKGSMQNQIEQLEQMFGQLLSRQEQEFSVRLREVEKNAFEAISLGSRQHSETQQRVLAVERRLKSLEQVVAEQVVNVIEPRFAQMKEEMQQMFRDVHNSIDNLERVEDGKMRLLEERISKELGELRKFVVLV